MPRGKRTTAAIRVHFCKFYYVVEADKDVEHAERERERALMACYAAPGIAFFMTSEIRSMPGEERSCLTAEVLRYLVEHPGHDSHHRS